MMFIKKKKKEKTRGHGVFQRCLNIFLFHVKFGSKKENILSTFHFQYNGNSTTLVFSWMPGRLQCRSGRELANLGLIYNNL